MAAGGDQVPIGARGISLSGGQKARVGGPRSVGALTLVCNEVSMARAAYHLTSKSLAELLGSCDELRLVLMDDPFASVDARPGASGLSRSFYIIFHQFSSIFIMFHIVFMQFGCQPGLSRL